jgi:hypothetical protein
MLNLQTAAHEWRGHELATSEALLALFLKAQSGGKDFSRAERVLFTACEFWAAAKNGTLREYLPFSTAIGKLVDAEESFETIGLVDLARSLRSGLARLGRVDTSMSIKAVLTSIEDSIAKSDEPVDKLLAQFACEQTWESTSVASQRRRDHLQEL